MKFHLQNEGTPLALNILNNMQVDNVLIGTDSAEEAFFIFFRKQKIFKRASMNLRQWNSNSEEFLKSLPAGKLFLQKLWKINQPWDEPLSEESGIT